MAKLFFGDIVVVEKYLIGVVVKSWGASLTGARRPPHYEVYVRSFNAIVEYPEDKVERYGVRHKELDEKELYYQNNAIKGL